MSTWVSLLPPPSQPHTLIPAPHAIRSVQPPTRLLSLSRSTISRVLREYDGHDGPCSRRRRCRRSPQSVTALRAAPHQAQAAVAKIERFLVSLHFQLECAFLARTNLDHAHSVRQGQFSLAKAADLLSYDGLYCIHYSLGPL